jgi:ribosomal protein S18 acetylase RimI-like enzyme
LVIAPEFRRRGIGESLGRGLLEWMRAQGCVGAVGMAWRHGGAESAEPLLRKAGFARLAELPEYYREGSRRVGHHCPVCRGECGCAAVLYGRRWD